MLEKEWTINEIPEGNTHRVRWGTGDNCSNPMSEAKALHLMEIGNTHFRKVNHWVEPVFGGRK